MKRVLVCPLDWGLGHATRCIPIIRSLLTRNDIEVLIGGNGASLQLLANEFPALSSFELPGYNPEYPSSGSMAFKMVSQIPKFNRAIRNEHEEIERIVKAENISVVISDNRYGAWSKNVPSVLITHQSNIMMPKRFGWLRPVITELVSKKMRRFSSWWIPDFPDRRLSGDLTISNSFKGRMHFIGGLSRFENPISREKKYDLVVILSGPEPQRSIFENKVLSQLKESSLKYFIVGGLMNEKQERDEQSANYLLSDDLQELIETSKLVICRSGYSSVMDLNALKAKAVFVPTPGQTEQEYLAAKMMEQKIAYSVSQNQFDLNEAIQKSGGFSGFRGSDHQPGLLDFAINELLQQVN